MRAYMAWDGQGAPEDGAVLVFAATAQEARVLAYPAVSSWTGCDFIDVRTRWLRKDCAHLRRENRPHVVDDLPTCKRCELWHAEPLLDNGMCQGCTEWFADDPEAHDLALAALTPPEEAR